ncbi:MAG: FKBP-type peptidyl-prolyl cis-trans isomerase [Chloroflexales bacterium]|nr:FKBP-type peptidyl-prolyl cis-trans isomerase [Chloroflexales bacterium]
MLAAAAAALLAACGAQPPAAQPSPAVPGPAQTPTGVADAGTAGQEQAVTTPSGLQFIELVPGAGDKPKPGDVVDVHYRGTLDDGTQFDSSYSRGDPIQFVLGVGAVIPGWDEGIAMMRKGGKAKLIVPPNLAYGARGAGGVIPPNATLTFEVELVEIRPGAPAAPTQLEESQYTTTPSGLKYADLQVGTGAEATAGKPVAVHYTGWLTDGKRFDTSRDPSMPMARQKPFTFTLGRGEVIKGWDEGVAGMRVGGKRQIVIPPGLAYGTRGAGNVIPPGATLIFEVELIEVR